MGVAGVVHRKWTAKEVAKVKNLLVQGVPIKLIAVELNRTVMSVKSLQERQNIRLWKWLDPKQITKLHLEGLRPQKIAEVLGCAENSVRRHLSRIGLKPNTRRFPAVAQRIGNENGG